jgi:hypothetical protein
LPLGAAAIISKLHRRFQRGKAATKAANAFFTTEALSSQSSEHFLIKNALLGVLRASALQVVADQPMADQRWVLFRVDTIRIATEKFAQAAKTFKHGNTERPAVADQQG